MSFAGGDFNYLVELQHIEQLKEFFVLFVLFKLYVVLLQTVQRKFCFIIDVNFHWLNKKKYE